MRNLSKSIFILLGSCLFFYGPLWSQAPIHLKANDFVTTTLFFPSKIQKVVPPAENFKFSYENGSNIGLLKGSNGRPSNLLVITEEGYIYSFALNYAEEVENFSIILTTDQAISRTLGNNPEISRKNDDNVFTANKSLDEEASSDNLSEKNKDYKVEKSVTEAVSVLDEQTQKNDALSNAEAFGDIEIGEEDLYDVDREEYYRIYCENNYLQKTIFKRSFRQNKKIVVRLNNILVDRNEKYFVLQIENNSRKEFEIAGLSFFKKLKIGQLEKIMEPLYVFNLQERIDPGGINEVVYVFKNFDIVPEEKINVVLADAIVII